ncbi:hypothetical protein F4677DRAFT_444765 [Hypoxylon crocopeplum]|nr:hypothetical protein F4677DRAFT_444765 [Hypoxylon crocopeplum]
MCVRKHFVAIRLAALALFVSGHSGVKNSTYYNPVIPGWHSDNIGYLLFRITDPFEESASIGPLRLDNPGNGISPDLSRGRHVRGLERHGEQEPGRPALLEEGRLLLVDYLMLAEACAETNQSTTIASATDIHEPYEDFTGNLILITRDTNNYFQTVGHW